MMEKMGKQECSLGKTCENDATHVSREYRDRVSFLHFRRKTMPTISSPLPQGERAVIGFFLYASSIFTFGKSESDIATPRTNTQLSTLSGRIYRTPVLRQSALPTIHTSKTCSIEANGGEVYSDAFRYWSIAIAGLVITLLIGIVVGYYTISSLSIPALDNMRLIHGNRVSYSKSIFNYSFSSDRHTRKPSVKHQRRQHSIAPVSDMDLARVNRILYSKGS
jgi:hypothetical protein